MAVEGWRAGGQGQVLASTVQCREPKTGQHKVQLSSKTKHFAHLGMINLWPNVHSPLCKVSQQYAVNRVAAGTAGNYVFTLLPYQFRLYRQQNPSDTQLQNHPKLLRLRERQYLM